jgi:MFS family permease
VRAAVAAVWAVIVCTFFVQAGNGLQADLISLRANAAFDAGIIGLMMACYYVGYCVAPLNGRNLIGRVGHVNAVILAMAVAGGVILIHPLLVSAPVWGALRAISGFMLSLSYVAVESWINERVPNALRGRVFSVYMFAQLAGMAVAQVLVGFGDAVHPALFVLSAALFLTAAIPVAMARRTAPSGSPPEPLPLLQLFRLSPLGSWATVLAGLSWAIIFTFGPIYAHRIGLGVAGVGLFMGTAMTAGGLLQLPLGWLSDIGGRRRVLGLMFVGGLGVCLAALLPRGPFMTLVAVALMGACVFPIYTVSAATVNDHVSRETRVAAASGLVLLFGIGSIFGPLLCGWAMQTIGLSGFYGLLAATMGAGVAVTIVARR